MKNYQEIGIIRLATDDREQQINDKNQATHEARLENDMTKRTLPFCVEQNAGLCAWSFQKYLSFKVSNLK